MGEWHGSGAQRYLDWAGRSWSLNLENPLAGLMPVSAAGGCLLALGGLCAPGRHDDSALGAANLTTVEQFRSRVQATYAPKGWADLQLRASWSPTPELDGVDLEIQVNALSVDELRRVEVLIWSCLELAEFPQGWTIDVQPRDRLAAGLSYDGRQPMETLRHLRTKPVPVPGAVAVRPVSIASASGTFLQMVHPDDVARWMVWRRPGTGADEPALATCAALFGHDLEKGVVLRGRLRTLWVPDGAGPIADLGERAFRRFVAEPPPLGM